uniref:Uncharacterized protein n=1 Tax=viral metagenome TaxID=1070528 RepID=A0A6M3K5U6_9ZZZZ
MSESTLQITFTELETETGRFLGYDRTVGNWSAAQVLDLAAILKRGLRQFYFPPRTPSQLARGEEAHRWSFLRPRATLDIWDDLISDDAITATATYASPVSTVTASGAAFYPSMEEKSLVFVTSGSSYVIDSYVSATQVKVTGDASAETGVITVDSEDIFTLPWDFGGMVGDGRFKFDNSENRISGIDLTTDVKIGLLRQASISAGTPYLAAIVPLTTAGAQGQRWGAQFYPPPNDVLTLHYRYYILPGALVDSTAEYPYGSVPHSEAILESCLAIAEIREKDDATTTHRERFMELLQGSIDHDRQYGETVQQYGYNGDNSDGPDGPAEQLSRHYSLLQYDGQTW